MMTDNNFVPRALEEDEEAIVDLFIDLAGEQIGDIIELNLEQLQKLLHKSGAWKKYKLTSPKQFEIIRRLSEEGIISMDCIVDRDFINNYRSVYTPECKPIEDAPKLFWLNNTDWARETFQLNGHLTIEQAYENHHGSFFIKMTLDDVEKIEYYYKATHELKLSVDDKKKCLCLQIDEEKPIKFNTLAEDKNPYKILKLLNDTEGNIVTRNREQLKKAGIKNIMKTSLSTQMFSDNGPVKAFAKHKLLILLEPDEITYIKSMKATLNQIHLLKADLPKTKIDAT